MKKLLDIIRKAMEVKNDLNYMQGQVKILDYIIEENREPENIKSELMAMYESSIESYQNWDSDKEDRGIEVQKLKGAANILAWLLDIPQKVHKNNMKKKSIEK